MRSHSHEPTPDLVHDEAVAIMKAVEVVIVPLLPKGWKYSLWIHPGDNQLKYWSSSMSDKEFSDLMFVRLERAIEKNGIKTPIRLTVTTLFVQLRDKFNWLKRKAK